VKLSLAEEKLHSEVTSLQNKVAVLGDELRVKSSQKVSAIEGMKLKLADKEDTIIQQSKYFWGIYYYFFK